MRRGLPPPAAHRVRVGGREVGRGLTQERGRRGRRGPPRAPGGGECAARARPTRSARLATVRGGAVPSARPRSGSQTDRVAPAEAGGDSGSSTVIVVPTPTGES